MNNYKGPGEIVTLTAPYEVASGAGALVGSVFGVATSAYANGAEGEFMLTGKHYLAKATGSGWTVGALIYWDNTAKKCTATATDNTLIGFAYKSAASGDAFGYVRLNGACVPAAE